MGETVALIALSAPCKRLQEIVTRHAPLLVTLRPRSDVDSLPPGLLPPQREQKANAPSIRLASHAPLAHWLARPRRGPAVPDIGKLKPTPPESPPLCRSSQRCLLVLHGCTFACLALPAIPSIPNQVVSWTPTLANGLETATVLLRPSII
ncbi:hypothetical protein K505DRAFT_116887 [Melanomma pulvis-pyrius CBS 109.77]|uniref:Uncharacterized protein n=1 Tax=Melanomma pulvis-pyrius CBS 109.77 TaxID=1314802 RepID=A0A6A6WW06_9PLEO|nr:hypothetical protein K505DRAFT_116887 [Melanomma pulvis-pyrius CBS 109.77]